MEGKELVQVSILIIFWIVLFFIIKRIINKSFSSQKRIEPKSSNFYNDFYSELQEIYHLKGNNETIELSSEKLNDIIAGGKLYLKISKEDNFTKLTIKYQRKMKFIGFIIVIISLLFCYVGVLVPIFIVQDTKKKAFKEVDRIYEISKGI